MKLSRKVIFATFLLGCSRPASQPTLTVDGSSTVFPITDAVADQFQKRNPVKVDVKVPVGISGTRGGFRKFCAGQTDISDASRPINAEEAALCAENHVEFIEVPIGYDGLTVVVNAKNSWANDITTDELKKIWEPSAEHRIVRWSQVRAGWPDKELHLFGAGFDSGTYDYFTDAIVHKEHSSRSDFKASESDDELAKDMADDELSLGFFGYAYLYKNAGKLKAVAVDDGDPSDGVGPIAPTPETVRKGTYQPLSRPLFIYVSKASLNRREVALFVAFYLSKQVLPSLASDTCRCPTPPTNSIRSACPPGARDHSSGMAGHAWASRSKTCSLESRAQGRWRPPRARDSRGPHRTGQVRMRATAATSKRAPSSRPGLGSCRAIPITPSASKASAPSICPATTSVTVIAAPSRGTRTIASTM